MSGHEWLSWEQAAAIVGCPVPTIDWYKRLGRIRSRPHHGARPSLKRSSVEEFAVWWAQRQAARARAAEARRRAVEEQASAREGWLSPKAAGELLGCSAAHVAWLFRSGELAGERVGRRIWLRGDAVEARVQEHAKWVSIREASRVLGCSARTVAGYVQAGDLVERRPAGTRSPTIDRSSLDDLAQRRQATLLEISDRAPRPRPGPVAEDGEVWLDARTTAAVLGITANRVHQLASAGRLPHRVLGRRRWFRRDHIEQVAAAREVRQAARRGADERPGT